MNFLDRKELTRHAMKSRYGWRRFFVPVPSDITKDVTITIARIKTKIVDFDDHQSRLDFVRKYPIED